CGMNSARGGGVSGGGSSGRVPAPSNANRIFPFLNPSMRYSFENFTRTIENIEPWVWIMIVFLIILVGIAIAVLSLFLGALGTTGVIKGTAMADDADDDAKPLSFGEIFKVIKPYYWKVLLLNLGLRILGFVAFLIFALPIVLFTVCTCFLGLFLLVPIGWFIDLMIIFTTIAIIEEDKDVFDAISRAWQVITREIGYVVVMFLILGIGQLIISLIILLPLIIVPMPLLINLFATGFQSASIGLILSILLFLALLPFLLFLAGVVKAYVLASWTLTYRTLVGEEDLKPVLLNQEAADQTLDEDQED
ncbi:MAG: hypothetical protein SVP52_09310, partial [Chloroflexota bacterium]|nr:hypothetical protein [Chloroflexota bacterium]